MLTTSNILENQDNAYFSKFQTLSDDPSLLCNMIMLSYLHTHTHTHTHTHISLSLSIYIYIYIYRSRYHTITDVNTTALLLTKPSSDGDSGFRHGFRAEASLPLTQRASAVSDDTTRICQIVVAPWDCQINADAVGTLSWIFSMYFFLSDGGSPRLVKKTEV